MRIAVICPGRGTYTRTELGSLARAATGDRPGEREALLAEADAWRMKIGREPVTTLDGAASFSARHLAGENAAALIFCGAALDHRAVSDEHEVVAVLGNSMGWYIALHVAGCLDFSSALRLVDTMGGQQLHGMLGGQLIWPLVGDDWRPDPARAAALEEAYAAAHVRGERAWPSIHLGGLAVIGGDDGALATIERTLPKVEFGRRPYPFRLLGHSAFHTPLLTTTADRGRRELADLPLEAPRVPLIDGRGHVFSPLSARPRDLFDYTLGAQVVEPYDFTASVRVALREYAPDALLLLGPGDTLGGAIAQVLIGEGWRGLDSREAFLEAQQGDRPPLLAMARENQRARVV